MPGAVPFPGSLVQVEVSTSKLGGYYMKTSFVCSIKAKPLAIANLSLPSWVKDVYENPDIDMGTEPFWETSDHYLGLTLYSEMLKAHISLLKPMLVPPPNI
mmetsp:Transcript_5706/g.10204  ORF Transcript_5706/g.10204 Transcript_5706/m.10204 type:complete len:101 (+) Transcript_5706:2980-3282(+)